MMSKSPPYNYQGERNQAMVREREAGDSWAIIGERHGISWGRARQIIRREIQREAESKQYAVPLSPVEDPPQTDPTEAKPTEISDLRNGAGTHAKVQLPRDTTCSVCGRPLRRGDVVRWARFS